MKLITAIVRRERLNQVLEALFRAEVRGLTLTRAQGHGGETEHVNTYRGTRVKILPPRSLRESRDAFLTRFTREARERHGIGPAELVQAISRIGEQAGDETVYVVECSTHQCEQHANELQRDGENSPDDGCGMVEDRLRILARTGKRLRCVT